jgi:hypothetical protein
MNRYQRGDRQTLLLRNARRTAHASCQLRHRIQLRPPPEDAQRPHTHEFICKLWTKEPHRFILVPLHQIPGLNTRKSGRAPKGERLRASVPHGHWKTTTFVAGLRHTGLTAPFVLDGPINGLWFQAYVDQVLVPTLRKGDIVVMDNLGSHKGAGVRNAALSPALQSGFQPDRDGLLETQGVAAKGRRANRRRPLG